MNGSVVIVGAGQAGVSVAFKLRSLGYQGRIVLVGDEPGIPYQRPPLSKKYLTAKADVERLHIKARSLYESERIELHTQCSVAAIDRETRTVTLTDGTSFTYDYLILATGAIPRGLPLSNGGSAPNVHTFRTLADAERLRPEMKAGNHMLVVGGGYIGLETAAVARSLGMEVTLVERDQRILGRVASKETADYFRKLHTDNGVRMYEGANLVRHVDSDHDNKTGWIINEMLVEADVVVVGIGVTPNIALAKQMGLAIDNGIVVDDSGRTSDSLIFAAGDCASIEYLGRRLRIESIQNAVDMAENIARSITASSERKHSIPWFWSDQYLTKLQIAGLNIGYTEVVIRKTSDACVSLWYYEGDRFLAVDAINDVKSFMTAKQWLATGCNPSPKEIGNTDIALNDVKMCN